MYGHILTKILSILLVKKTKEQAVTKIFNGNLSDKLSIFFSFYSIYNHFNVFFWCDFYWFKARSIRIQSTDDHIFYYQ